MSPIKKVAVIGLGPAGAIAIDALAQEKAFDTIRVFERREDSGGCWLQDPPNHKQVLPSIPALTARAADAPLPIPSQLPTKAPASSQYRFSDTTIYPHLETNIAAGPMSFSAEPFPDIRSEWSIRNHGTDTPFRHWKVVKDWISSLVARNGYNNMVEYNTTVESVQRNPDTHAHAWTVVLRKTKAGEDDYWWSEDFDAVVVANGHYTVPFLPDISGLAEYHERHPNVISHSKSFRYPQDYKDKTVVVVGASISGADLSSSIAGLVKPPLISVVRGRYHPYFGDYAFQHPKILRKNGISHFDASGDGTVHFADGTSVTAPDAVIFGTGYSWSLPFLENVWGPGDGVKLRNNRLPGLYQHVFYRRDPTLTFVGAVAAGFTFKVFEWQSVLAARYLAGRITLPPLEEQEAWEQRRIELKGDGVPFSALYPDFEKYFEEVRLLAGEPKDGVGRKLPKFEKEWRAEFDAGHLRRIAMWKRNNQQAEKELLREKKPMELASL
ncbi:putative gamma-glutamyl phosphate reductase [Venturia nashicola]|nr:putative gamma-glutamyl phosphate reductase [Venturia nashicola]